MRILIVGGEFVLAQVLAQVLTEQGHDVDVAIGGPVALARMADRPPDLVLLEAMMPILDGPEFLRRMRTHESLAPVAVILMTARPNRLPPDVDRFHQGLLVKPFTPDQLLTLVHSVLGVE